jgi:Zn-dependent peptidase ImmA (M78 family)
VTAESDGKRAAENFRSEYHLGDQPLGDLVALIEQTTGYDVAVLDAGPDEHGMTMRDPERSAVFIAIASTANPMRQRSTLAHELAHILFADWAPRTGGAWDERSREEVRADAFARHVLIPLGGLKAFVGRRSVDDSALSAVVQHFLVSPQIAAIAMRQAKLISDFTKAEWGAISTPNLAARFGWSDQYRALQGESRQRRAPQRLLARAIAGYAEGIVSLQTIATLRRVDAETVEAELREAGITPTDVDVEWADPSVLPVLDLDLSELEEDEAGSG